MATTIQIVGTSLINHPLASAQLDLILLPSLGVPTHTKVATSDEWDLIQPRICVGLSGTGFVFDLTYGLICLGTFNAWAKHTVPVQNMS